MPISACDFDFIVFVFYVYIPVSYVCAHIYDEIYFIWHLYVENYKGIVCACNRAIPLL